jgi:hypothetical protein
MSTFPSGDSAAAAAIFARALNLSRTASTCFVAILGYDWLVNLPQEYRKIWKSVHRTPIKWIYLFLRYWTILAGVGSLAIYHSAVPTSTCVRPLCVVLDQAQTEDRIISQSCCSLWLCQCPMSLSSALTCAVRSSSPTSFCSSSAAWPFGMALAFCCAPSLPS